MSVTEHLAGKLQRGKIYLAHGLGGSILSKSIMVGKAGRVHDTWKWTERRISYTPKTKEKSKQYGTGSKSDLQCFRPSELLLTKQISSPKTSLVFKISHHPERKHSKHN